MKKIFSKSTLLVCLLLFTLSFSLRLVKYAQNTAFGDDQGRDAMVIREHIDRREPFVLGPKASVSNFYLPPFYYYFMSVPMLLFFGNARSMYIFTMVIESLTPALVYLFVRRNWSNFGGKIAGTLYALSSYAVIFGSAAWGPNTIPFFTSIFLLCMFEYLLRKRDKFVVPALVSAALALQLHYQSFILVFFIIASFSFAMLRQRRSIKHWLIGAGLGLLTFAPMLFNVSLTIENLQNIASFFTGEHSRIYQTVRTFDFFWNFIPHFVQLLLGIQSGGYVWGRTILVVAGALLAWVSLRRLRDKAGSASLFYSLFLGLSFIGLRLYKGDKLEYYLLFLFTFPAILTGIIAAHLPKRIVLVFAMLIAFYGGAMHSPILRSRHHDFITMNAMIEYIDAEYQDRYTLIGIPYAFYKDPLRYLWTYEHGKSPWLNTLDKPVHLLICRADQHCAKPYCTNKECASLEVVGKVIQPGYVQTGSTYFREFEIVELTKQ